MKISYPLFFLGLCACNCPSPMAEPVNVTVPLAVPCEMEPVAEPGWNVPRLPTNADDAMRLKALLADLQLSRGYIEELQATLAACES